MPIDKERISSPLEAGPSILDAKQLPIQLTNALDYVSNRLARKRLHLSLIVVRKDVNMPDTSPPQSATRSESPPHSLTTSPARSLFSTASTTFSTLTKHSSQTSFSSDCGSTTSCSSGQSLSRTRHPGLPSSPKDITALPAISPSPSPAPSSPTLSQCPTPTSPNPYGISLMHASTLTARGEKVLRQTISKAEKKFSIG